MTISAEDFYYLLLKNDPNWGTTLPTGKYENFKCGCYVITIGRFDKHHYHASIEINNVVLCVSMEVYSNDYIWISRPPTEIELTKIKLALI